MILPELGIDFWVVAIIAVIFIGIAKAGFGGGVGAISTPLLALAMPVAEAAALLLPLLILADQVAVYRYADRKDSKSLWVTIPASVVGIGIAWYAFDQLQSTERPLKIGIGIVSVLFVLFQLSRDFVFKQIDGVRLPNWAGALLGATAGFTSTLAHVGGPPYQIYLIPQKLPRDIFVGTNAWFFWAINLIKLIPFWFLGLLTIGNLFITLILIPFVIVGVYFGVWLNGRVRQDVFNWIIYILLSVTGIQLILGQSLLGLIAR